jgi:hypothetical protein
MLETMLRRAGVTCAVLMLFGVMSDRTTWVRLNGRGQTITDGAVYNLIASLSGIIVLIALAVALHMRPRLVIPALSLLLAVAAFGLSAFVSGLGVWARSQGKVWAYGVDAFADDRGPKWVVYPADGPYIFTFLATLGFVATAGMGIIWLRSAREDRSSCLEPAHRVTVTGDA